MAKTNRTTRKTPRASVTKNTDRRGIPPPPKRAPALSRSKFAIHWGHDNGRTVIKHPSPMAAEVAAQRWRSVESTLLELSETADALATLRNSEPPASVAVLMAAVAARAVSLIDSLRVDVDTFVDLSPALRAALVAIDKRKAALAAKATKDGAA